MEGEKMNAWEMAAFVLIVKDDGVTFTHWNGSETLVVDSAYCITALSYHDQTLSNASKRMDVWRSTREERAVRHWENLYQEVLRRESARENGIASSIDEGWL